MFGTLTLIKRNGSEGSTMTMDSRETTIGRYVARALAYRPPPAAPACARSSAQPPVARARALRHPPSRSPPPTTARSDAELCDVVMKLPEVSKVQAALEVAEGEDIVYLRNMSKTNPGGTMLNGAPIEHPKPLNDKDIISICGRTFRFEAAAAAVAAVVEAASAKKATPKSAAKGKSPKPATPKENTANQGNATRRTRRARRAAGSTRTCATRSASAASRSTASRRRRRGRRARPLASPMPIAKPANFDDVAVARPKMPTPVREAIAAKKEAAAAPSPGRPRCRRRSAAHPRREEGDAQPAVPSTRSRSRR